MKSSGRVLTVWDLNAPLAMYGGPGCPARPGRDRRLSRARCLLARRYAKTPLASAASLPSPAKRSWPSVSPATTCASGQHGQNANSAFRIGVPGQRQRRQPHPAFLAVTAAACRPPPSGRQEPGGPAAGGPATEGARTSAHTQ